MGGSRYLLHFSSLVYAYRPLSTRWQEIAKEPKNGLTGPTLLTLASRLGNTERIY